MCTSSESDFVCRNRRLNNARLGSGIVYCHAWQPRAQVCTNTEQHDVESNVEQMASFHLSGVTRLRCAPFLPAQVRLHTATLPLPKRKNNSLQYCNALTTTRACSPTYEFPWVISMLPPRLPRLSPHNTFDRSLPQLLQPRPEISSPATYQAQIDRPSYYNSHLSYPPFEKAYPTDPQPT
jgi:hypothetical protein